MGIIEGLFAGRAGIQSHGSAIAVLADNIANANTVGFKQSRADFADLLASSLGRGAGSESGSGSQVVSNTSILTQGTLESTGRGLDVGIDGNGYFIVQDANGDNARYYTRAGNFRVDSDGYLLDQNGFRVQGFLEGGTGGLTSLNVNQRSESTVSTSQVGLTGNLDAAADTSTAPDITASPDQDFADLNSTAQFSTFLDVYDSLGARHTSTVYFFHTAANTWTAQAYVDGGEVTGGTAGVGRALGEVELTFDGDGSLSATSDSSIAATPAWNNGANAGDITYDFAGMSQFSTASSLSAITQDGTGGGSVVGFNIEKDGQLFAQLDNGQTSVIGRVALANFGNPEALRRSGNSLYAETNVSGEPVIGNPDSGIFGSLNSGTLELSNSDIAGDFIKLIALQRGFQGSSRVINSINDLLTEIINLA